MKAGGKPMRLMPFSLSNTGRSWTLSLTTLCRPPASALLHQKSCWTSGRVSALTGVLRCGLLHLRMVEEPHGVLVIVAGRCREGIEQLAHLLDCRCLTILR